MDRHLLWLNKRLTFTTLLAFHPFSTAIKLVSQNPFCPCTFATKNVAVMKVFVVRTTAMWFKWTDGCYKFDCFIVTAWGQTVTMLRLRPVIHIGYCHKKVRNRGKSCDLRMRMPSSTNPSFRTMTNKALVLLENPLFWFNDVDGFEGMLFYSFLMPYKPHLYAWPVLLTRSNTQPDFVMSVTQTLN